MGREQVLVGREAEEQLPRSKTQGRTLMPLLLETLQCPCKTLHPFVAPSDIERLTP